MTARAATLGFIPHFLVWLAKLFLQIETSMTSARNYRT